MSKLIDDLKAEIVLLENKLEMAKNHHYVHESHSLHCQDGELYIYHNGINDEERCVVINVEQLLKDLPFIIDQTIKENKKMQEMYLNNLKDSIKKL